MYLPISCRTKRLFSLLLLDCPEAASKAGFGHSFVLHKHPFYLRPLGVVMECSRMRGERITCSATEGALQMCYHLVRALPTTLDGEEKERCHEERFSAVARAEKRSLGACVRACVRGWLKAGPLHL